LNIQITKLSLKLTLIAFLSLNTQVTSADTDNSSNQICNSEGALGLRFGDKFSGSRVQADTFLFGRGCYLVKPPTTLPYFDTYAACVSELDNKIYQIQASKTFDTKPPQGSSELSAAQVSSNRELGKQALDGLLARLPKELAQLAKVNEDVPSWELSIEEGVTLEVENAVGWAVTFECRNEASAVQVFKHRIWGR
jgi:hypothetical protein